MSTPPVAGGEMVRGRRARWVAWVLLCWCLVMVARGHGIAPAALLLAVAPESAPAASILAALGITLLAASLVPRRPTPYVWLSIGGMFCLGLSLMAILPLSELAVLTVATMVPFLFVSSVWASRLDGPGITEPVSARAHRSRAPLPGRRTYPNDLAIDGSRRAVSTDDAESD